MVLSTVTKKGILKGVKAFNDFTYVNADKLNEKVVSSIAQCEAEITNYKKDLNTKKRLKAQRKANAPKREFGINLPSLPKFDLFKSKEGKAKYIAITSILDKDSKPVSESFKGLDLVGNDFEKNPMFVKDENSNQFVIKSAQRVDVKGQSDDEVYVLICTDFVDFIVKFKAEIKF